MAEEVKAITCYICKKDYDTEKIVNHLRSHTDLEARIAYREAVDAEKPKKRGRKKKEMPVVEVPTIEDNNEPKP